MEIVIALIFGFGAIGIWKLMDRYIPTKDDEVK